MLFDPYRALAELRRERRGSGPATSATSATASVLRSSRVAEVADVAAPLALSSEKLAEAVDAFEERATIREFDGGQPRAEAERGALNETAAAYGIVPEVLAQNIGTETET